MEETNTIVSMFNRMNDNTSSSPTKKVKAKKKKKKRKHDDTHDNKNEMKRKIVSSSLNSLQNTIKNSDKNVRNNRLSRIKKEPSVEDRNRFIIDAFSNNLCIESGYCLSLSLINDVAYANSIESYNLQYKLIMHVLKHCDNKDISAIVRRKITKKQWLESCIYTNDELILIYRFLMVLTSKHSVDDVGIRAFQCRVIELTEKIVPTWIKLPSRHLHLFLDYVKCVMNLEVMLEQPLVQRIQALLLEVLSMTNSTTMSFIYMWCVDIMNIIMRKNHVDQHYLMRVIRCVNANDNTYQALHQLLLHLNDHMNIKQQCIYSLICIDIFGEKSQEFDGDMMNSNTYVNNIVKMFKASTRDTINTKYFNIIFRHFICKTHGDNVEHWLNQIK